MVQRKGPKKNRFTLPKTSTRDDALWRLTWDFGGKGTCEYLPCQRPVYIPPKQRHWPRHFTWCSRECAKEDAKLRLKADDLFTWRHFTTPELRLVQAKLERHVFDVHTRGNVYYHKSRAWVESRSREPWSYLWCCEVLGIHAGLLRERLT